MNKSTKYVETSAIPGKGRGQVAASTSHITPGIGGTHGTFFQPRCACGGRCPQCQTDNSLHSAAAISEKDEGFEREADQVAESVLPRPANTPQGARYRSISPANESRHVATLFPQLSTSGKPLPDSVQLTCSRMFGQNFSDVRYHTGAGAEKAADSVQARAFAYGKDIVFNRNEYRPDTQAGKKLLAHELTHVLQQREFTSDIIQRTPQVVDCEGRDRANILQAERTALQWIDLARRRLANPSVISPELAYHFQISPDQTDVLSGIASIFEVVRDHIQREEFTYTCTPESDSRCEDIGDNRFSGFAYIGSQSIYFCGNAPNRGETSLVSLLIHEAIHAMIGGLDDGPYINDPTYPGPEPLSNTDAYSSFIRDIATSRVYGVPQRTVDESAGALPDSGYMSSGSQFGQDTELAGFAVNSAVLSQDARNYLDIFLQDWYDTLGTAPMIIRLAGHSDSAESANQMAAVSQARAAAVADYFMENMESFGLFPPEDIQIESFSASRPFTHSSSATGHALNRRVSIEIVRAP